MHSSSEVLPEKPQMSAPTSGMLKRLKLSSPEGRESQQGAGSFRDVSEQAESSMELGVLVGGSACSLCYPPGME